MNEILDLIVDWFVNYSDMNNQRVSVDSDDIARIHGEFDLKELADFIYEQVN